LFVSVLAHAYNLSRLINIDSAVRIFKQKFSTKMGAVGTKGRESRFRDFRQSSNERF
jgi:hypothetical protein